MRACMSQTQKYSIDFTTASESDLQDIIIPLTFDMQQSGHVHGLAFWFEVAFIGSQLVLGRLSLNCSYMIGFDFQFNLLVHV